MLQVPDRSRRDQRADNPAARCVLPVRSRLIGKVFQHDETNRSGGAFRRVHLDSGADWIQARRVSAAARRRLMRETEPAE
jgi:hypothetical protein